MSGTFNCTIIVVIYNLELNSKDNSKYAVLYPLL